MTTLALVVSLVWAPGARAQTSMPGQGFASGGGHAYATGLWLTAAFGQPVAGRAGGGGLWETAGWLRLPAGSSVSVPLPPAARAPLALAIHPNPASAQVTIAFHLPAPGAPNQALRLRVYDISGRLVRELDAGSWSEGDRVLRWDGTDARGARLPSGVYLCRLRAGSAVITRRMVLVP